MWKFGKYRTSFKRRFGISFPYIQKGAKKLIWIHAVSMGETKAVLPLAKSLKEEFSDALFLISSVTETGHAEAKKSFSFFDFHVYLPFDFSWIIGPIIKRVKPDLIIISENDLWYHFLSEAKKNGAKIAVVNGKLSERSLKRFSVFSFFAKKLFSLIDLYCLQSDRYKERFLKLNIPEEKLVVTGNLKLDAKVKGLSLEELQNARQTLKIKEGGVAIVAGSTHPLEEELLIRSLLPLWSKFSNLKLLLVPRHPERFNAVASLLKTMQIPFCRFSEIEKAQGDEKVLLIDAMGVLLTCYQIGDIAIVGGSFVPKIGGHNILEPAQFGKPVLFGPFMHSQQDFVDLIHEFKAGLQINESQLTQILINLIEKKDQQEMMGKAGIALLNAMRGANERTLSCLKNRLL